MKDYTFRQLYDAYHQGKTIRLNTPDGPKTVIGAYKKHNDGRHFIYDDGTETKGSIYHLIMSRGEFKPMIEFKVGDTVTGANLEESKVIVDIQNLPAQDWYDFSLDYEHECYIQNDIIHHNSGKSLIIYCLIRWYAAQNKKCLLIVPTTSLVEQMYADFQDYSNGQWNVAKNVQMFYSGKSKHIEDTTKVIVSTWQSLVKYNKKWFNQFDVGFFDEAHNLKSNSLTSIMEKMTEVPVKIGTTGTIPEEKDSKVHSLVLVGLLGPIHRVTSSKELMDKKVLAQLNIKMIVLKYDEETRKKVKGYDYQAEIDWLVTNEKRNKFIKNVTCGTKTNTLVMFQYEEKQGAVLYDMIKKEVGNTRKVFYVHGGVDTEEREHIRQVALKESDCIIIASFQTLSTGTNIPNIETVIFASPSKSKIRNLQSIGRGLRLKEGKTSCELIDIADDLSWKSKANHTLRHAAERMKIYSAEEFDYKVIDVKF